MSHQPSCMAASSTPTPAPSSAVDWKQELRAEIMRDMKEQMAELSRTLLQELRQGRPSLPPGTVLLGRGLRAKETPRSDNQFQVSVG